MTAIAEPPKLLTVDQAADVLQVGRVKMFQLVTTGAVRSIKIGKLRRVPVTALDDYITAQLEAGPR